MTVKERAKQYFEEHPDRPRVVMTDDAQAFYPEHEELAKRHARESGIGFQTFDREDILSKGDKVKEGSTNARGKVQEAGDEETEFPTKKEVEAATKAARDDGRIEKADDGYYLGETFLGANVGKMNAAVQEDPGLYQEIVNGESNE